MKYPKPTLNNVATDPQFSEISPPHDNAGREVLKNLILVAGEILDPTKVWYKEEADDISDYVGWVIVDGHTRHDLYCSDLQTIEGFPPIKFESILGGRPRKEVLIWCLELHTNIDRWANDTRFTTKQRRNNCAYLEGLAQEVTAAHMRSGTPKTSQQQKRDRRNKLFAQGVSKITSAVGSKAARELAIDGKATRQQVVRIAKLEAPEAVRDAADRILNPQPTEPKQPDAAMIMGGAIQSFSDCFNSVLRANSEFGLPIEKTNLLLWNKQSMEMLYRLEQQGKQMRKQGLDPTSAESTATRDVPSTTGLPQGGLTR